MICGGPAVTVSVPERLGARILTPAPAGGGAGPCLAFPRTGARPRRGRRLAKEETCPDRSFTAAPPPCSWRRSAAADAARAGKCHDVQDPLALLADPVARPAAHRARARAGLGDQHHPITTRSRSARSGSSTRACGSSTRSTTRRRCARSRKPRASIPSAAMAYWGWALVLGPNLNLPMKTRSRVAGLARGPEGDVAARARSPRRSATTSRRWPRATANDPKAERAPLTRRTRRR